MAVKRGAAPDNPLLRYVIKQPQFDYRAKPPKAQDVRIKKLMDDAAFKREADKINREVLDD